MTRLRQAIDARENELIEEAESKTEIKLKALNAQRDELQLKLGQLKSCSDFVNDSRHTHSQGKLLMMKSRLLQQIEDIAVGFKRETLVPAKQADMKFYYLLPDLVNMCRAFGKVYCHSLYHDKCKASGEGIKVATSGVKAYVSVEALNGEGEPYLTALDSLKYELVSSDGSIHIRGTGNRIAQNVYEMTYEPQSSGEYKLHININDRPIFNSPFPVTVLPCFSSAANIIDHLDEPIGIAIGEGGEVVVVESGCHCVSIINHSQEKESFGTCGITPGEFDMPEGVAIDCSGNIIVADVNNHRIQQFSSTGNFIRTCGRYGSRSLQFKFPRDVAVHPHTHKVYVADWGNNRIQILSSDLTYFGTFGRGGFGTGEFDGPSDISTDKDGNVYVADCGNHRIQVFTVDGVYFRQFGKEGEEGGQLKCPVSIAIDSNNVVYVGERGNNRVSIFFTNGEFIKYSQVGFNGPFGLAIDKNGKVYVSDTNSHCIQIFQ